VLGGGTVWLSQKVLQYIILEFSPSIILLYPPLPIPGLVFPFTHMCTQYLYHIHPPTPFSHTPSIPTPQTGPVLPSYSPIL
jgi:hypothetical protein